MKKEISNLITTVKDVTKGYVNTGKILSKSPESRIAICVSCEHYKASRCMKCGCFVALKTKFEFAKCPINKW